MKDFTPCEHGSHPMGCIQCQLAAQPPATPQDIKGESAEIHRLGDAVRDGSATPEMAYAWLTHPYVCTSDMVRAAARIMASAPPAVWQDKWDARESALRALVAQWKNKAESHRRAAHAYTGFADDNGVRIAQMHRTLADCIDAQAHELERLLESEQ